MSRPSFKGGFTLLEMLLALAIIGILSSIALYGLFRYSANQDLVQAVQSLSQALNQARSEARRVSTDQTVSWTVNTVTVRGKLITFARGVVLSSVNVGPGNFNYSAPYGRRDNATDLQFNLDGRFGFKGAVRVQGVTGKVINVAL